MKVYEKINEINNTQLSIESCVGFMVDEGLFPCKNIDILREHFNDDILCDLYRQNHGQSRFCGEMDCINCVRYSLNKEFAEE